MAFSLVPVPGTGDGQDPDLNLQLALCRILKSIEELERTAIRLEDHYPQVAAHVRALAHTVAGQTLDCLGWSQA